MAPILYNSRQLESDFAVLIQPSGNRVQDQRMYVAKEGIFDQIAPARSSAPSVRATIGRRQAAATRRALATSLLAIQLR